jgi:hypothetical protein
MSLACRRLGLPVYYGKGFDALPDDIRARCADTLVRSLDAPELSRALKSALGALVREGEEAGELRNRVEPFLRELVESVTSPS